MRTKETEIDALKFYLEMIEHFKDDEKILPDILISMLGAIKYLQTLS